MVLARETPSWPRSTMVSRTEGTKEEESELRRLLEAKKGRPETAKQHAQVD